MSAQTTTTYPDASTPCQSPSPAKLPRLWPPATFVLAFWILHFVVGRLEKLYFIGFIYSMASAAVLVLLFFGWWWSNRRIRLSERLYGFAVVVGMGMLVAPFCHKSIWFGLPTVGLPAVLTAWTLWMLLERKTAFSWNRLGLFVVVALTWGCFVLVRVEGINADLKADTRWRWRPSVRTAPRRRGRRSHGRHNNCSGDTDLFRPVRYHSTWAASAPSRRPTGTRRRQASPRKHDNTKKI